MVDLFSSGITGEKQYLLQMNGSEFDYWIVQSAADIIRFCRDHDPIKYLDVDQASPLVEQLNWLDSQVGFALNIRVNLVYGFVRKAVENPSGFSFSSISDPGPAYQLLAQALTDYQEWEQNRSRALGVPTSGKKWTTFNEDLHRRFIRKEEPVGNSRL